MSQDSGRVCYTMKYLNNKNHTQFANAHHFITGSRTSGVKRMLICKVTCENRHGKSRNSNNVLRPVRLAYKPYFFSQQTIFFSHNKLANSTFIHGFSAKRTWHLSAKVLTWACRVAASNHNLPSRKQYDIHQIAQKVSSVQRS